jgi:ABC-type Na+ efflux pump permease subunit
VRRPLFKAPFPLLRKELVEQSARRRTYIIRVLYAMLLGAFFALILCSMTDMWDGNVLRMLGNGDEVFAFLVGLQFVGIYVFLPGMMAGTLAGEKERDSLSLLLVTDLRPWEIVLEKLGGRLVPMFTFLLLGLPFLAIAYSFGGVTADSLLSGAYFLTLTCLQVGAFALMLSAFSRTTAQAFVGCYVLGTLFYFALPIIYVLADAFLGYSTYMDEDVLFAFLPPYVFFEHVDDSFAASLAYSIPAVLSTGVFLVMARVFVVRRAFLRSRPFLLSIFRRLDAFWHRANRLTGGIVLIKDADTLPGEAPVLWREVNKHSLGKASHLVRVACILGVPIAMVATGMLSLGVRRGGDADYLTVMLVFLWILAVLAVAISSAASIASERVNQTLDVLLSTPLTGRDIVLQKARGRQRLAFVMAGLIFSVVLLETWVELRPIVSTYVLASVLSLAVYLPMVTWVSMYIGLKVRTPARAIIITMAALALWCGGPPLVMVMLDEAGWLDATSLPWSLGWLLSPASIIGFAESGHEWDWFEAVPLVPVFANFLWHAVVWALFRALCLVNADAFLGRVPEVGRRPLSARSHAAIQET